MVPGVHSRYERDKRREDTTNDDPSPQPERPTGRETGDGPMYPEGVKGSLKSKVYLSQ